MTSVSENSENFEELIADREVSEENAPDEETVQEVVQEKKPVVLATEQEAKPKQVMSEKQKAALEKARNARSRELRSMQAKRDKERREYEEKDRIEQAKKILELEKERKHKERERKKAEKAEKAEKTKKFVPKKAQRSERPVAKTTKNNFVTFGEEESDYDDFIEERYGNVGQDDDDFGGIFGIYMTETQVPRNWLVNTNTFARPYSDPRGEGVQIFSPVGESEYSTKSRNLTPIKITMDSNSVSFIFQKLVLSMDVSCYGAGGALITPGTAVTNTYLGLDSIIQSMTVKAGGEAVQKIDNYPAYINTVYKNVPVGQKKLMNQLSGYGNTNVFKDSATVTMNTHPWIGFFHPSSNDQFFHPWALPNQAIEITLTLADPSTVFTSNQVQEIRVTNIRCILPYITPPPPLVVDVTRALSSGRQIFCDYTKTTQTENACSGGLRNTVILHMSGVRSLVGFEAVFVDNDVLSNQAIDKALMYNSQNLREWKIQLGSLHIPQGVQGFTHGPNDNQTLLVSQLSNNTFDALGDMDISFKDYDQKQFSLGWSFMSKDEASSAALNFSGTDALMRLHTVHASPPPSQKVRLLVSYAENVSLSIGGLDI
ncbi:hypothetical protein DFS34DRAFT_590943 [Phlyctochytrium arcticum]|nr:hypothetical protein DFS34DRAFT_590943 [Phlyctochytrium arcticum]